MGGVELQVVDGGKEATISQRIENIEKNIGAVSARVWLPAEANQIPVQLVCFGPSLRRTWGLIDPTKPIVTVSGAHDFLRGKGITPNYHVEFDWRPHKAHHVTDIGDTQFWLASCCHPDLVNKVPAALWHAEQSLEEIKFIKRREGSAFLVPGGSSAGLRAIELFIARGHRHFEIFGMDSSFDERFGGWAGQHFGRRRSEIVDMNYGGHRFRTTFAFVVYAQQFQTCRRLHPDVTFNLHGEGLLQTMKKMEKFA